MEWLPGLLGVAILVAAIGVTATRQRATADDSETPSVDPAVQRLADLYDEAKRLHIPPDAISRFVTRYMNSGLSEEQAVSKLVNDTIRDRARYRD